MKLIRFLIGARALRVVTVVLVAALVATGCGSDDTDAVVDDAPDAAVDDEPDAAVDEPDAAVDDEPDAAVDEPEAAVDDEPDTAIEGLDPAGVVRVGYDLRPETGGAFDLDPALVSSGVHDAWLYMVYGRLLRPTQDGGVEPDLAESATVIDSGTIEVTLREGLTFSDGTPFDAEAVKAGLERNLAQGDPAAMSESFFLLTAVEVTGPNVLRLTIADGAALGWMEFLADWQTTIAPDGVDPQHPIGAGPFVVTSFEAEQSVVFAKSETYWDAESILFGGIEIVQIASGQPQSGTAALQAGQIDLVISEAPQLPALTGDLDALVNVNASSTIKAMICKASGPLADPLVRRAINMAINRNAIGEAIYAGTAEPATQLWPEGHRFANPDLNDFLAYDPEGAVALLEEAGYPDGVDVDIYVIPALGLPEVAEVMQQQLGQVGINLNLVTSANFVADYLESQVGGLGLIPGSLDGRRKLTQWSGDAIGNVCGYDNPALNDLGTQLQGVGDSSDEAVELWHEIAEIGVKDALSTFILFRANLAGYNTERLGAVDVWPVGSVVVPDPRETWVRADS